MVSNSEGCQSNSDLKPPEMSVANELSCHTLVSEMNYEEKLKGTRFRQSTISKRDFNEEMESDRGRSINSAAVRRLQQKTQVFPLETNAAVRSRLTHSLEVQQVGRYISKIILKKLREQANFDQFKLTNSIEGFISAVEISCLLHDIGNPPFGHFGEEAINLWAKDILEKVFEKTYSEKENHQTYSEEEQKTYRKLVKDITSFEGNAQGIRILHQLQNLNLTYTQLACLIKYTRAAYEDEPEKSNLFSYRKKKPGYYFTEEGLIKQIRSNLLIEDGCRFPLTYIMEAADDISYCIADIDDAVEKGVLTIEKLDSEIRRIWEKGSKNLSEEEGKYLLEIATEAMEKSDAAQYNKQHEYILKLRTTLVNHLAEYAAKRFVDNHQEVFNGSFDESLLNGSDKFNLATETLRKLAVENVFNDPDVENLELKGYAVISGLLRIYSPLINLTYVEFKELTKKNR